MSKRETIQITNRRNVKKRNNDLQNTTQKTKDRNKNQQKQHVNSGAPACFAVPTPLMTPVLLLLIN